MNKIALQNFISKLDFISMTENSIQNININSETNIVEAYVYEDGVATEYLEFTLDGETFSVNKPMVNINVVISEGNTNTTSTNKIKDLFTI